MTIKVSIVVPVYNTEKYLQDALHSVVSQTLSNIEVVCVDDGSTDRSADILQDFSRQDSRVVVVRQENAGPSAARNKGIRYAKGEYIYFLDSDDKIVPEAMERLYQIAVASDADTVFFDAAAFFDTKAIEEAFPQYKAESVMKHKNMYSGVFEGRELYCRMVNDLDIQVSPCLHFVRRKNIIDKDIWFPEGIIHEDNFFFFLNLINSRRAVVLPESLFLRRVREGSITTVEKGYMNIIGYYEVACKILDALRKEHFSDQLIVSAVRQVRGIFQVIERIEQGLDDEGRKKLKNDGRFQGIPYELLIKPLKQMDTLNSFRANFDVLREENTRLKNELDSTLVKRISRMFRAGRK